METYGFEGLLNPQDPCLLGLYTIFFHNIWNTWNTGDFVGTTINFARINDDFLEGLSPVFYEKSKWPLKDAGLRTMRAQLLYNMRKFRILALNSNKTTLARDHVIEANTKIFIDEMHRQIRQRSLRILFRSLQLLTTSIPRMRMDHPGTASSNTRSRLQSTSNTQPCLCFSLALTSVTSIDASTYDVHSGHAHSLSHIGSLHPRYYSLLGSLHSVYY